MTAPRTEEDRLAQGADGFVFAEPALETELPDAAADAGRDAAARAA